MTTKDGQREWVTLGAHCNMLLALFLPNEQDYIDRVTEQGHDLENIKIDRITHKAIVRYLYTMRFGALKLYADEMQAIYDLDPDLEGSDLPSGSGDAPS